MDMPTHPAGDESDQGAHDPARVDGAGAPVVTVDQGEPESSFPPLYKRVFDTFFSPDKMAEAVAREPRWAVALLVAAFLFALQFGIIPGEVYFAANRAQMLATGRDPTQVPDFMLQWFPVISATFGTLAVCVMTFLMSGVYAIIFVFVLGDEGRYSQYLAMSAHALFIPALVGLCLTPMRISMENPQAGINLATFFSFLPSGYWKGVLTAMDVTQIWSALVMAQGIHTIDKRRSFTSAATVMLGFIVVIALIFGRFIPT